MRSGPVVFVNGIRGEGRGGLRFQREVRGEVKHGSGHDRVSPEMGKGGLRTISDLPRPG